MNALKGVALIAVFMACSAQAGEHWVCSFPHADRTRTVFSDYEVSGDKLLSSGLEYQIVQNDDSVLIAARAAKAPIPDDMGQVVGIDKRTGQIQVHRRAFPAKLILSAWGDCQQRTDKPQ